MEIKIGRKFPFFKFSTNGQQSAQRSSPPTINWPTASLDVYFSEVGYQTTEAGVTVNSNTALKHAAYWRAINLLSSQIASFPLTLFWRVGKGKVIPAYDHPAYQLMQKPNDIQTPFIFRESMQANVLTNGNAYGYIERNGAGKPLSIRILDSTKVKPKLVNNDLIYVYNQTELIDPYFMFHIPGLSFDGIEGKAPLQIAAESIGTGLAMQKYINDLYANGAKQSGVLTHPHQLSAKAREGLRQDFDKKMKDKQGGTLILDEGMKYQTLSIPPDQQQLIDSRRFSVEDMARWFGIPPHLLFEESRSTFNNIAEQGISFVQYTLTQWVVRWEHELNQKLLTDQERGIYFFKFNMNALMRGNPKDRFEAYRIGLDMGVYSINEVRKLEEMNAIDGGDQHLVQLNRTPLNNMNNGNTNN